MGRRSIAGAFVVAAAQLSLEAAAEDVIPSGRARATWIPPSVSTPAGVEALRSLLFADQLPEERLPGSDFAKIGKGHLEEARKAILADRAAASLKSLASASPEEMEHPEWLLLSAYAHQKLGRLEEAKKALRKAAQPSQHEARNRLWACRALRALGEAPEPSLASEFLGVVVEVPLKVGVDSLAAYPDGTARYVNQGGAVTLYDPWSDPLREAFAPAVSAVTEAARRLVARIPIRERVRPTTETVTILTCGGAHSIALSAAGDAPTASLMSAATRLLLAMVALTPDDPAVVARCKKGDASACVKLADQRANGFDFGASLALRARACELGSMAACYDAGNAERTKPDGLPSAALHFEKACLGGVSGGCNNFALMLDQGMGLAVDKKRAAEFMQKACDLGELLGCANLGSRYAFGIGVPKDRIKARALLDKACAGGIKQGCVDLRSE